MKLKDKLLHSTVIITGTIIPEKMEMILGILQNNFKIFGKFTQIVLNINCVDNDGWEYAKRYEKFLTDYANEYDVELYLLRDYINRGWQFGTIDIEKTAYSYCINNHYQEIVLKLDFDIYLEESFLEMEIVEDVMIMPSIGYATTHEEYKGDFDKMMELYDKIPPQSTIYLITSPEKIDDLYIDPDWLNMKYKEWILNPVGNGPHHIGVACEPLLRQSFERNNLKIRPMISKKSFRNLVEMIEIKKIVDPSHKNIFFEEIGMCHFFGDTMEVIKV